MLLIGSIDVLQLTLNCYIASSYGKQLVILAYNKEENADNNHIPE